MVEKFDLTNAKRNAVLRRVRKVLEGLKFMYEKERKKDSKHYNFEREKFLWDSSIILHESADILSGMRVTKRKF